VPSWLSGIVEHSIRRRLAMYHDLVRRVLVDWDDLQARAERVADEEWTRLMSEPGDTDVDVGALAERANAAGQDFYDTMFPMGQTLMNLFAAGLYHLFEQQLVILARAMMSSVSVPSSMPDVFSLFSVQLGIDIATSYSTASHLDQLRLIANVVKHAEGGAAQTLRRVRPDLFEHPVARGLLPGGGVRSSLIRAPLAGEGIFVTRADYEVYATDIDTFWSELRVDLDRTFA
jgi:hypothetical protein